MNNFISQLHQRTMIRCLQAVFFSLEIISTGSLFVYKLIGNKLVYELEKRIIYLSQERYIACLLNSSCDK